MNGGLACWKVAKQGDDEFEENPAEQSKIAFSELIATVMVNAWVSA